MTMTTTIAVTTIARRIVKKAAKARTVLAMIGRRGSAVSVSLWHPHQILHQRLLG
jgi:hypothetical protein